MPDNTSWSLPKPPLALTMGDPAGVGPEIALRAWLALRETGPCFMAVGAPEVFDAALRRFKLDARIEQVASSDIARHTFSRALPILPLSPEHTSVPEPGRPDPAFARTITASIETAIHLCRDGKASGIVTNPISKSVLYAAGFPHPGHTEYLAELCKDKDGKAPHPVMMLVGGGLRVALVTIHMALRDAIDAITISRIETVARITHDDLQGRFGLEKPRIALTGLNPHAGEDGNLGQEEIDTINPAAERLRAQGLDVSNARPADTVYAEALAGRFDAVIAMTHDQGLIPVKTLDIWGGVNVTLGLPIIRTSPDHGTAFDIAAKGVARPDSLIAALRLAADMADRTRQLETTHGR